MIDQFRYECIKQKYGHYASWAVWADEGTRPKDNIGDISVLDPELNPALLTLLNPEVILVGLNISRRIEIPFANFHDAKPQAMDFKIRFALSGSPFWGAYMTDIIKDFEQKSSGAVMSYLAGNKDFEKSNTAAFLDELSDLRSKDPIIIAFGRDAYQILKRNLKAEFKIFRIPHYSNYIGKEKYREEVKSILGFD